MKTKAKILVVEDNSIIYKRLKMALIEENYTVFDYSPSVEKALERIHNQRPDVVLLDIDLQGDQTGLDLGRQLHETYHIPFIYVTDFEDNQTFYEGLHTHHEHFIVKTKPELKPKEVVRAIQTVLQKTTEKEHTNTKKGIVGLVNYLDEVKKMGISTISKVPVEFEDIGYFTVKSFMNKSEKKEYLRANYLWFKTKENRYLLKKSLKEMQSLLPYYFVRINESYIVNISPKFFNGRINGTHLSVLDEELIINNTYKKEFIKRFKALYES